MFIRISRGVAITGALVVLADPAFAHHVMGGSTPSTFTQGLLAGLGHPVIGIDHLAFLVAAGVAVAVAGLHLLTPILFVAASAAGVAVHVYGIGIPGAEFVVAASVIAIGALIARGKKLSPEIWMALFGASGLFHGYAFGESIFGAETTPLAAYLIGLVIIQSALAIGIAMLVRKYDLTALAPRFTGAVVAGVGLAVLAQQLLPTG